MSAESSSDQLAEGQTPASQTATANLPPPNRIAVIRKRSDFLAANKGLRCVKSGFILLVRRDVHQDGAMRVGFTVTKKIGNAVIRNRMKRRFRALARKLIPTHGTPNADHILIGRADGIERDYALLERDLANALNSLKKSDGKQKPWQPRRPRGKASQPGPKPAESPS